MKEDHHRIQGKSLSMFRFIPLLLLFYVLFLSSDVPADQSYSVDGMSGLYAGAWVQTAFGFTYYEPVSGFADLKGSRDAIMSDAVYYRYNKALDLFVLIYRGFQDYESTLDGIRNYVAGMGCEGIQDVTCNGLGAIRFENQTDHYRELNIAFPDSEGAIIQVTVQCSNNDTMYAFGQEVFSSVLPNASADAYLSSVGEESFGHVYHLSDFGSYYQGAWVSLVDFFRFCAPSDSGWTDLTGTETALSCDAIAMYQNDSLGIVIVIYYGFQPYNTTAGIYDALSGNPDYLNLRYARCNGLKVVEFEKENRDHSIAFADNAGGIVQVTVQCQDPTLRYLYSDQLFSSLSPTDLQTADGEEIPQEYKSFLCQSTVTAGEDTLSLEGSQYALFDLDADGSKDLLVRCLLEGSWDGLGDIYVFIVIDGRVEFMKKLSYAGFSESAGAKSITFTENTFFGVYIPAQAPVSSASGLTEEEKKVFASFLAEENWLITAKGTDPSDRYAVSDDQWTDSRAVYEKTCWFSLVDVTGDGHEELAVCWNSCRKGSYKGNTFFYKAVDHDVVCLGMMPASEPYFDGCEAPGYSSIMKHPYVYSFSSAGNPFFCFEMKVYRFDNTCSYDEIRSGDILCRFRQDLNNDSGEITYSINDEEVSFEEYTDSFTRYIGQPVPSVSTMTDEYEPVWEGFETIASLENTPQNRKDLLGYTGGMDTWEYWLDSIDKGPMFTYEDEYISFCVPEDADEIITQENTEAGLSCMVRYGDVDGDFAHQEDRACVTSVEMPLLEGVASRGVQYPGYENLFPYTPGITDIICIDQGSGGYEFQLEYTIDNWPLTDYYRFINIDEATGLCMLVYYRSWRNDHESYYHIFDLFNYFYKTFELKAPIQICARADILPVPRILYGPE